MIRNSALGERLNLFKSGQILSTEPVHPTPEQQKEIDEEIIENSMIVQIGNFLINIAFFLTKCVAFGYAFKIVFNTDWKLIAVFAIGFSVEVMTTKIFDAFRKT
jgi:hypothetical protein